MAKARKQNRSQANPKQKLTVVYVDDTNKTIFKRLPVIKETIPTTGDVLFIGKAVYRTVGRGIEYLTDGVVYIISCVKFMEDGKPVNPPADLNNIQPLTEDIPIND